MKSHILVFLTLTVFFLLSPLNAFAQTADCSPFSLSQAQVDIGESVTVRKSDGLDAGQVVRASILNTSLPQQVRDCEGSPAQCNEVAGGIVDLFDFDTSSLTAGNYAVEIFYSDGANTCTTTRSLSVAADTSQFCSPLGITDAFPLRFSPNEDIGFEGCIGPNPCNGQSFIVITDRTTNIVVREIPLTSTPGSCNNNGEFTRSFGGFSTGLYSAQLRIGVGSNAGPAGDIIEFEVESGQDQFPDEGNPCTVIEAGLVCSGINQQVDGQLRCVYEADQCISCSQCVEPLCSAIQRGACIRSVADSAGQVAEGCVGGKGRVNTAIGCIPFNVISSTTRFFLAWSLSIGGGVALLLIGISALMFATSSGNPDKVAGAKSLFWAAITGLGMLILSVFLLRFIGVDVLGLFA